MRVQRLEGHKQVLNHKRPSDGSNLTSGEEVKWNMTLRLPNLALLPISVLIARARSAESDWLAQGRL